LSGAGYQLSSTLGGGFAPLIAATLVAGTTAGNGLLRVALFAAQYPDYRRRLLDTTGEPLTYFSVFLDDDNVPRHERKDVMVKHGSTITIVPPLAGG